MNFKKFLLAVLAVVIVVVGWQLLTRVDRSNPIAVATAFTKALKARDTGKASGFVAPDKAATWRTAADENIQHMRTGTMDRFFEAIPSAPVFTLPASLADNITLESADKGIKLDLTRITGKWYIAKAPI